MDGWRAGDTVCTTIVRWYRRSSAVSTFPLTQYLIEAFNFLRSPLSHSSVFRHVLAPQSGKTTATQRHFLVWMTEFEPYSKFAFIIMKMNSKHFFLVGESPVKFLCVSLSLLFVFFDILLWMRAMRMARHFSNCCVSSLAFVCHFWQMNNREKWNCCDRDDDDNNETRYYNTKNN